MHPPIRHQADIVDQARYSAEAAVDCSNLPDTARQEFKREADVNYLVQRFGIVANIPQRIVSYGERDFDLDLHRGFIARDSVDKAWFALSPELRKKYPTGKELLDAMNSGELRRDLEAERAAARAPAEPPAETPAPEGAE